MQKDIKDLFGDHHGLDERSLTSLTKALEKSNLPGFDYIEFKQALLHLQDLDIEESVAFKSAFATASTMGLTKEKLLKTTTHYKKILIREKQQFDVALKKQMEQRVNSKRGEVEKLKKQMVIYQEKIEELKAKIAKAQDTIDNADEHIQAAKDKIESTKEGFEHTLQSIVNQIDKDIENINTYL